MEPKMNKIKTLFLGTPDFAVPCFEMLCGREDIEICGVVTQPDKQKGRGYQLLPPPVKEAAALKGLDVYQPSTLKDGTFMDYLRLKQPDLIIVIAYGKILPSEVIHFPKYGCLNVHASLLPKYRGAAPIQWSLIQGETKTGVTIMQMDEGLDTGDMLVKMELPIQPEDTAGTLFDKLSQLGCQALSHTIDLLLAGDWNPVKQDPEQMTYAPMITKEFSYIDWSKDAQEICCLIRGLNPSPGAKAVVEGKLLKLFRAEPAGPTQEEPGTVLEGKKEVLIACGNQTSLRVLSLQPEGKKVQQVSEFLKGHELKKGINLRR